MRFHYCIAQISSNPVIAALHDAMSSWLTQQRVITLQRPGLDKEVFAAHQRIFDGIASGDPGAAEQAMQAHMEQIEGLLPGSQSSEATVSPAIMLTQSD